MECRLNQMQIKSQNRKTFVPVEGNVESLWTQTCHVHPNVAKYEVHHKQGEFGSSYLGKPKKSLR